MPKKFMLAGNEKYLTERCAVIHCPFEEFEQAWEKLTKNPKYQFLSYRREDRANEDGIFLRFHPWKWETMSIADGSNRTLSSLLLECNRSSDFDDLRTSMPVLTELADEIAKSVPNAAACKVSCRHLMWRTSSDGSNAAIMLIETQHQNPHFANSAAAIAQREYEERFYVKLLDSDRRFFWDAKLTLDEVCGALRKMINGEETEA